MANNQNIDRDNLTDEVTSAEIQQAEQFREQRIRNLTKPSLFATFIAGFAQARFSKHLQPVVRGLSEQFGKTIRNALSPNLDDAFIKELAKRTGARTSFEVSNVVAQLLYRHTGSDAIVRFTKVYNAAKEAFNLNAQSFLMYQGVTKMFQPSAKLSLQNYLLQMGIGSQQSYGYDKFESKFAQAMPEEFVAYKRFLHSAFNIIPQTILHYGKSIAELSIGTQNVITAQFIKDSTRQALGGAIMLSSLINMFPLTQISSIGKMVKGITSENVQRNAIGLHSLYMFKEAFENVLQSGEYDRLIKQKNIDFRRILQTVRPIEGRSRTKEQNYQQFIYWLEHVDDKDPILKSFLEDLEKRFGKHGASEVYKKAGLEAITFEDIAIGRYRFTEIMGYFPLEGVEPEDILNQRMQQIQSLLISRGLRKDLPIGIGIYKMRGKHGAILIEPFRLSFLKSLDYFAKTTKIPYLGFNPAQLLQPTFWLEQYYRPTIAELGPHNVVYTNVGWLSVGKLQRRLLYRNQADVIYGSVQKEYGVFSAKAIRTVLSYAGIEDSEAQRVIVKLGQFKSYKDLDTDEFKQLEEWFVGLQASDNVQQKLGFKLKRYQARALFRTFQLTSYIVNNSGQGVDPDTLFKITSAAQHMGTLFKQFGFEDYQYLQRRQQDILTSYNQLVKDSNILFVGNKPFLQLGQRVYDISNIVPETHLVRKSQMTSQMFFTYAKQTGAVKIKKGVAVRSNARRNMPFYTDFNVGKGFLQEVFEMASDPASYERKINELTDVFYEQKKVGYMLGLKRSFGTQLTDFEVALATGIAPDSEDQLYQELANMLLVYGKLHGYLKYKAETASNKEMQKMYLTVANLLELSPAESALINEIQQMYKSGINIFSREWFETPVSMNGPTRKQILLGFGQYMYQIGEEINKQVESAKGWVTEQMNKFINPDAPLSPTNKIYYLLNNIDETFNDLLRQFNDYIRLNVGESDGFSIPDFFRALIDKYDSLRLDKTTKGIIGNTIFGVIFSDKASIAETMQKTLRSTSYQVIGENILGYLRSKFEQYDLQTIYKTAANYAWSIPKLYYYDTLKSVFGDTYLENVIRSGKYGIPRLQQFYENTMEQVLSQFNYEFAGAVEPISTKYDILIKNNRYLQISEFQFNGSMLDILQQLFPDVSKDQRQIKNVNPVSLMLHLAFGRTSQLLEEVGLGNIDTTKATNQLKEFQGVLTKVSWLGLAVQSFGVADQLITTLSGGIINPHEMQVEAQNTVQAGQIQLTNLVGIGPAQRYLHQTMPGFLSAVGGMYGQLQGGVRGMFLFQGLGALLEHIPYIKEFMLQSEGLLNVPVYQAQGWEFGREPYWGGRIKEYRPSLWYLEKKEWQYTPLLYGSKLEYQVFGQPYPTPLNLFGLIPIFSRHYDKKLLMYRPYPSTGSPTGTQLTSALGIPGVTDNVAYRALQYAFKVTFPRESLLDDYVEQLRQNNIMLFNQPPTEDQVKQYVVQQYLNEQQLQVRSAVGFNVEYNQSKLLDIKQKQDNMYSEYMKSVNYSLYTIQDLNDWLQNYLGFVGFAQSMLNPMSQDIGLRKVTMQTSDFYRTPERLYYQMQLGNMFGMTEFYRRINQSRRRTEFQINPLPNPYMILNFPWLPDRFLYGDQYSKIDFGEVRLPGPGYEYIRGTIDQYGPVDIYRILANVQPYSQVTDVQEQIAERIQKDENTDVRIRYLIEQQKEERANVERGFQTNERPFNMKLESQTYTVEQYLGEGKILTREGEVLELRGLQLDVDYIAKRIFERRDVSIEQAYEMAKAEVNRIEEQLRGLEGSTISVLVPKDIGLRYMYYGPEDVRTQAIMPDLEYIPEQQRNETAVDIRQNYQPTIFNKLWENYQHLFGFFHEKFIPVRSQYEEYARYYVYGQYKALWQRPFTDIVLPAMLNTFQLNPFQAQWHSQFVGSLFGTNTIQRQAFGGLFGTIGFLGQLFTPQTTILPDVERMREVEEQQMTLEYMQGKKQFYDYKTLQSIDQLKRMAPLRERWQIEQLQNQPQRDWSKILKVSPDYIKPILSEIYEQKRAIYESGYPEVQIEEDVKQYYEQEVYGDAIRDIPKPIAQAYKVVDVDSYRTLIQLGSVSNLQQMNIYETQIMRQMNSIVQINSRISYNYYQSQEYYVRQMQAEREDIYAAQSMRR